MWASAHARVSCIGYEFAPFDGEHSFSNCGIECVTLVFSLIAVHILGDVAMVAVEVKIYCSDISRMVDVQHFATVISGDAETRHIAVGGSIYRCPHAFVATDTEVDTTMEMIGAYLGKSTRRGCGQMQRVVKLRLTLLRRHSHRA